MRDTTFLIQLLFHLSNNIIDQRMPLILNRGSMVFVYSALNEFHLIIKRNQWLNDFRLVS